MSDVGFTRGEYGGPGPETYERFFVPTIGRPIATDLVAAAALQPGQRVLDVGCGTAIVARLAREKIGDARLAGLDPNPGMLGVAREVAADMEIEWHESSAESMPIEDDAFDVVLSQMALQFVPDKPAAAREMARVLAPGGRLALNVVGPRPETFGHLAEALAKHISPDSSRFVNVVFSLHDAEEVHKLITDAGLHDVEVTSNIKTLPLPDPEDFLWGYVNSTPLSAIVGPASDEAKSAFQQDVVEKWSSHVENGTFTLRVPVVVATATK